MPEAIKNAPTINEFSAFYLSIFYELSSSRQMGMSAGPIPVMAILEYARWYEFSLEETDDLVYFVNALDKAYLEKIDKL